MIKPGVMDRVSNLMGAKDRQKSILDWVNEQKHVEVEDIAQRFGVTTQTIRRDINKLCEQGVLRRRYGGVSLPASATVSPVENARIHHHATKQQMAQQEVNLETASYDIESAGEVCKDVLTNTKGLQKKEKAKGLYQQHKHAKKFQSTGAPNTLSNLGSALVHYFCVPDDAQDAKLPTLPEDHRVAAVANGNVDPDFTKPFLLARQPYAKAEKEENEEGTQAEEPEETEESAESYQVQHLRKVLRLLFLSSEVCEKVQVVLDKLNHVENKALRGLYCQARQLQQPEGMIADLELLQDLAPKNVCTTFSPFVVGVRKWTMRIGPAALPMTGVGCFMAVCDHPILFVLLPIMSLISGGHIVHLDEVGAVLDKKEVSKIASTLPLVQVLPGEYLWVPYGYMAVATGQDKINLCKVAPWCTGSLRAATAEQAWDMSCTASLSFAKKNSEKVPFSTMLDDMKEFLTPADKKATATSM